MATPNPIDKDAEDDARTPEQDAAAAAAAKKRRESASESPAESLGRAIGDVVTGADEDLTGGKPRP